MLGGGGGEGRPAALVSALPAYYSSVAFLLTLDICFLHSLPMFGIWDHIG